MLLLALDTATPAVTVALYDTDGDRVLAAADQIDARRHGELLLPSVDRVLREADRSLEEVGRLIVGVGPGPYTGLRVGLATAEAFGAALGIPVLGLCTLDGIAYASGLEEPFVVATDARRKEVYWARYADARTRLGDPVRRPSRGAPRGRRRACRRSAPERGCTSHLRGPRPRTATSRARTCPSTSPPRRWPALAAEKLAAGEDFLPPRPLYLRRPDARVPTNYKVVTPK